MPWGIYSTQCQPRFAPYFAEAKAREPLRLLTTERNIYYRK